MAKINKVSDLVAWTLRQEVQRYEQLEMCRQD